MSAGEDWEGMVKLEMKLLTATGGWQTGQIIMENVVLVTHRWQSWNAEVYFEKSVEGMS